MKLPSPLVVFIDRCLGNRIIATSLRDAGFTVEVHDDHFDPAAKDQDWLAEVAKRKWIVFTKDKRIKHRAMELAAIRASRARVFTLSVGNVQGQEMAKIFLKAMPRIEKFLEVNQPPFIARITRQSQVVKIYPAA